jgi:hypothetical protein
VAATDALIVDAVQVTVTLVPEAAAGLPGTLRYVTVASAVPDPAAAKYAIAVAGSARTVKNTIRVGIRFLIVSTRTTKGRPLRPSPSDRAIVGRRG